MFVVRVNTMDTGFDMSPLLVTLKSLLVTLCNLKISALLNIVCGLGITTSTAIAAADPQT